MEGEKGLDNGWVGLGSVTEMSGVEWLNGLKIVCVKVLSTPPSPNFRIF